MVDLISISVNKTKRRAINIAVLCSLAILLLVFTFTDLRISKALYAADSIFGWVFHTVGELPGYLLAPFFLVTLFFRFKNKNVRVVCAAALVISNFFWLNSVIQPFDLSGLSLYLIVAALMLVCTFTQLLLFRRFSAETIAKLFYVFLIAALFMGAGQAILQTIKIFWGRTRFYHMASDADFTRWFIPQGITGNKSFPSGHTSSSCAMLVLVLLCHQFRPKHLVIRISLVISPILFIVLTMFSRIVIGAHFASDVTFAAFLMYVIFVLSIYLVDKLYLKLRWC